MSKIVIVYKSVTGFTREAGERLAREAGCELMDLKRAEAEGLSGFDVMVFGGRVHAGRLDGLKRARKLFQRSGAGRLVIFATGAAPKAGTEVIEAMWRQNLTPEELKSVPHFYMQSGLRYEGMPLIDRMMMKGYCAVMNRQKKSEGENLPEGVALDRSFDISDPEDCRPLAELLLELKKN